jgi:hypothetical protein
VPPSPHRASDPVWTGHLRGWSRLLFQLAFWPAVVLTLFAGALELGLKQKEYVVAGPFGSPDSPPKQSVFAYLPQEAPAQWWRQPLLGNSPDKPSRSFLQVRVNGRDIGPPHRHHGMLADGATGGFNHWGSLVLFALPPGVQNSAETKVTFHYPVRPRPWVTLALAVCTALFGWLGYRSRFESLLAGVHARTIVTLARSERRAAFAFALPGLVLLGAGYAVLAAAIVFIATSIYAAATGWALPTTALIRWSALAEWAARNEPNTGHLLVALAAFGAIAAWLARLNPACQQAFERAEARLRQFLFRFGFIITFSMFVFCISAMWSGLARPGDLDIANIGGLIPFSDAGNYLTALYDQAKDGIFNGSALWRPLGIAFRSILFAVANFSLPWMLILQAGLVAGALCFATRAVILWRGVWAGLAFFGLTYLYARGFTATTLTEPLGIFWALLSIPFLIEAMVGGSARPALFGFTLTVMALMTRMGSMFTAPALLLWLLWQFGHNLAGRLRLFGAATVVMLAILSLNALLPRLYGLGTGTTTGNFAYMLCGLSMGSGWEGCVRKLTAEGKQLPAATEAKVEMLQKMAWENLRADPSVFLARLGDNVLQFAQNFPDVMWRGYGTEILEPAWLQRNILLAIALAGLLYLALRVARPIELRFWALFWISIIASASIIYLDDSPRTLAASQPWIALFLAIGLSGPVSAPSTILPRRSSRYGWIALVTAAVLFVAVPWLNHRFSPIPEMARGGMDIGLKPGEAAVFGGRRVTGFLVVEDGAPLRRDVATVHFSDFEAMIRRSGVETLQNLIHPVTPPLPFGFVFAPRLEKGVYSLNQFIVPAEVIERRDVPAWRFQLQRWGHKGIGEYWYLVPRAEPMR